MFKLRYNRNQVVYNFTNYITWPRASSFLGSKGDQTSFHARRMKSPRKWKTQLRK